MSEHDTLHVAWANPERPQARPDFLLGLDAEDDFPPDIRMQRPAGFQQMRSLPGVDHDDAIAMLDRPCIGRQPVGPSAISEDGKHPRLSPPAPFDLRGLDADETGLDGVNLHGHSRRRETGASVTRG